MKRQPLRRAVATTVVRLMEVLESRVLLSLSPAGGEIHVNNTYTIGTQTNPAIAVDGDGGFVVTWESTGEESAGNTGVYAQRFSALGVPQGGEIHVNTFTTAGQSAPAVAIDADGDFVIAWQDQTLDGSSYGIYAQRYDAAGNPVGGNFRVNSTTTGNQTHPTVAMDVAGDFVVAWDSPQEGSNLGVFAQRFNYAGVAQGGEIPVNTYTTGLQYRPAAAMDAAGDFVVTWQSYLQDGSGYGVYGQRFNAAGAPQGLEFKANSTTAGVQDSQAVAMDYSGDFVITWNSYQSDGGVNSYGVIAQRYNVAGTPQGGEIHVNAYTTNFQGTPSVALDADGDFLVAWTGEGTGDSSGVFARQFNAAGTAIGSDFEVNTFTTNSQFRPTVAVDAKGDYVLGWVSNNQTGDNNYGIFAQRYSESTDTAGPVIAGVLVDGLRVLPYQVYPGLPGIVVSFSEDMSTVGSNSVINPANWLLTWANLDITSSISSISYGYNSTTNRYEARFNLSTTYSDSNVTLKARDSLRDAAGNKLDGNFDGVAGGSYFVQFSLASGPRGGEFRVNGTTTGNQQRPVTAIDAVGDFVVAWQSAGQDGSGYGIYAQRYSASGATVGSEFRVNSTTVDNQRDPTVAMDASGDFVVAWTGYYFTTQEQSAIFAQRYSASGAAQGGQLRVNSMTINNAFAPSISMDASGNFVVAWEQFDLMVGENIHAQRFNSAGSPVGASFFQVNTSTTNNRDEPVVAMDASGAFVVAWISNQNNVASESVFARPYDASGSAVGGEIAVSAFTTGPQQSPAVAIDSTGDFVVAWTNYTSNFSQAEDYVQRYNAVGAAVGAAFHVTTYTGSYQINPTVAMDAVGDFVVAWTVDAFSPTAIYAQRFGASGLTLGGVFVVNSATTSNESLPAAAMDQSGDYVVAWQSSTQDGSGSGIYAQRLGVNNQTPTVGTLGDSPDPVISGNQVMLSASSVTDDVAATAVSFYRETNGLPGLQVGPEGDTLVGTALSPSGGIWTVNVSTTGLLAGPYTYWAQAYDAQGLTGAAASTVNTVNPPPGPAVASSNFLFQTAPQELAFTFDRDVSGSLSLVQGDLTVAKIGGGGVPAMTMLPYDHGTNTAGFTFNTLLADGNYEATLHASGITDPNSGMPMAGDVIFDFFMFAGDVNHDRKVDISDLQLLANNYNGTGKTFGQGDLNYDTLVNSIDLGILAARWQTSLSPPPPALPASLVPPIRRTPTRIVNTLA